MVLGRYSRLCETLPLISLTFDDNLPKCNGVHICRYKDIWSTSGRTLKIKCSTIPRYKTTNWYDWDYNSNHTPDCIRRSQVPSHRASVATNEPCTEISRRRSNDLQQGEMSGPETKQPYYKYSCTGSAAMKHRRTQSPAEKTDSIIALRLDKCTWRIVNDCIYRRDNIVHCKREIQHMSKETKISPTGDQEGQMDNSWQARLEKSHDLHPKQNQYQDDQERISSISNRISNVPTIRLASKWLNRLQAHTRQWLRYSHDDYWRTGSPELALRNW
jgi:hypothetical protein